MRKQIICICKNKEVDQLRSVSAKLISTFVFAKQIIQCLFLNLKVKASSSFFCDCTARFESDLVGTQIGFLIHRLNSCLIENSVHFKT